MAPASLPTLYPMANPKGAGGRLDIRDWSAQVPQRCRPRLMTRTYPPKRGEARLARHPVCPLRVFGVYKLVADSGDVLIQRRRFSIVDTHEPPVAMLLSSSCFRKRKSYPYKNQIFLVGRHQGVRRFVSPGLHHIKSVSSHCRTLHKKDIRRLALVRFFRFRRRLFAICRPSKRWSIGVDVPGQLGGGGEARAVWGVWQGDRKTGTVSSGDIGGLVGRF